MKTDFLIIGSGIAGLTTALTLADRGSVLIVTKTDLLDGSSRYAQAGIAAVRNFRWDSFAEHIDDTLTTGRGLNNKRAVKFLVEQAPEAVHWLKSLGVKFRREPTREAAHSHSRVWNTKDSTGETIERVLAKHVRKNKNIRVLTDSSLLDLIVERKVCQGAFVKLNGEIETVLAGKTVLATGGFGQLFARTTNPEVSTGDGIAAAYRAGARLKDLEFIQFHPTALVGKQTRLTLLSESLRGEGAVLRNSKGERFLPSYSKAAELAPRDLVARAIFEELKRGKARPGQRAGVYLDFTRANEKYLRDRFPLIWRETTRAGFNLARDLIPIFPVAHYACGGVVTNLKGETNVKNLLAIGEVARTGVHGANRLASNSLAEAVVFGRAVGETAKKIRISETKVRVPRYRFSAKEDQKVRKAVRTEMWERVGIVRTRKGLRTALKTLEKLKPKSLPAVNALTVAKLITRAALARKQSVGTHFVES